MEQNSLHEQQELLEAQIRECFGRVTYSHKTHEKCADILLSSNACIKLWQMILSGQVTADVVNRRALAQAAQAHRDLEARRTTGTTVLIP